MICVHITTLFSEKYIYYLVSSISLNFYIYTAWLNIRVSDRYQKIIPNYFFFNVWILLTKNIVVQYFDIFYGINSEAKLKIVAEFHTKWLNKTVNYIFLKLYKMLYH